MAHAKANLDKKLASGDANGAQAKAPAGKGWFGWLRGNNAPYDKPDIPPPSETPGKPDDYAMTADLGPAEWHKLEQLISEQVTRRLNYRAIQRNSIDYSQLVRQNVC